MAKRQHGGKRAGAGRPRSSSGERTAVLAVSVPESLIETLAVEAKRAGLSRSAYVARILASRH